MLSTLWHGFWLRCPHCKEGRLADGWLAFHETCAVCSVRFERKSGESAGASVIWVSILPILAMILFFILELTLNELSVWVKAGIPIAFTVIAGIAFYRNVRGLWIAVSYLTGGVYRDEAHADVS